MLDGGKLVQLDAPDKLLLQQNGIFYGMAKDAGIVS